MDSKLPSTGRLPVVAFLGRPNVGKSSLFNRLVGSRIAIEDPRPGTTRDRVSFKLNLGTRTVELIDAAGMGMIDEHRLEEDVEQQIGFARDAADVVIMVTDIRDGVLPLDERVAKVLRKTDKPVILLANKADNHRFDAQAGQMYALGVGDPICTSAREKRGIDELKDLILDALPPRSEVEDVTPPAMKLAIVGKRNAGKSSLTNFLAEDERVIVSEIPGTTRDAVDVHFKYKGMEFTAIDTAGIQRDRSIRNSVEFFSQSRSTKSMRRADVIILMMDCLEQTSKLDRKLAEEAIREVKPIVIGVNKWDLAGEVTTDSFSEYVHKKLPMLRFAPQVFLSVHKGQNCFELVDTALELHHQAHARVTTGQLNRVVQAAFSKHRPRARYGKPPRLFYATQVEVNPPEIVCFVNDSRLFRDDWREYLKGQMRKELPFAEIPIKIVFRNREKVAFDND